MAYDEIKTHGVTASTPENIFLGAGTIHKNFMFGYYAECAELDVGALEVIADNATPETGEIKLAVAQAKCATTLTVGDFVLLIDDEWNFPQSLIGATSGGNKLTITPEIKQLEIDGALVRVKGLDLKQGETATLEINFAELTPEIIMSSVIGQEGASGIADYSVIESKADITDGDYYDNLAFVGKKSDGTPIIVVLDNAICTSGFSIDGKPKDNAVIKVTFECTQELTGDLSILPYHIYYPTPA